MDGRAPGSKVGKHDTKVYSASECAYTETANSPWRCLSKVGRSDDRGLADTNTGNKPSSVNLTDRSSQGAGEENDDTNNPDQTELTCSPYAANLVGDEEGDQGSQDRSHLHHGGDVGQELCLFMRALCRVAEAKLLFEGSEFGRCTD